MDSRDSECWHSLNRIVTHFQEYDLNTVAQKLELPGAFILGAAAGPYGVLGMNAEVNHPVSFCLY